MKIPNLAYLRNLPDFGKFLYEAFDSVQRQSTTIERQVNGNAEGQPQSPPAINSVKVTGQNGHFNVAIEDAGQVNRGIRYYVEHDTDPSFSNPHVVHLGDSRNANLFLGNQQLYFRAYSAYGSSAPSAAAYHGSPTTPLAVRGGGSIGGPAKLASQGSGTGAPGVGLSGPGPLPRRDPSTGVNWTQGRAGTSGITVDRGATPTEIFSSAGAGAQVSGGGVVPAPTNRTVFDSSATLANLPVGLGAADAGTIYRNTFFQRNWIWDGSAWHYNDGGVGAGGQVSTSGSAPSGGLWTACDGVAVTCALDNATTASLTPSNTAAVGADNPMIEGGAGAAQQAATAPTGTASTGNDSGAGTVVQSGTGATVATHTHTHTASVAINAPSEANGGLPLRVSMKFWMRR